MAPGPRPLTDCEYRPGAVSTTSTVMGALVPVGVVTVSCCVPVATDQGICALICPAAT